MKSGLKDIVRKLRARFLGHGVTHLPIQQAFDKIYREKLWAGSSGMLSGFGSYGHMAESYAQFLRRFIAANGISSITDVGCGDFNVGKLIVGSVERYVGLDISPTIIEKNRSENAYSNCSFDVANACTDPIPSADLVTVRQVFQHLTNAQIEQALQNIESSSPKYVLVTEHWPGEEDMELPNKDMRSHSEGVRASDNSGVVLYEPPFSRPSEVVWSTPIDLDDQRGERLVCQLLVLNES